MKPKSLRQLALAVVLFALSGVLIVCRDRVRRSIGERPFFRGALQIGAQTRPVPSPALSPHPGSQRDAKPEKALSPEELRAQRDLESAVRRDTPTHRLVFDGQRTMIGRLVTQTLDRVVFEESYRDIGTVSRALDRSRVEAIEPLSQAVPPITARDVRFKMEFPAMNLFRTPPYTVVTDESFFKVQDTVKGLHRLHGQIAKMFSPVIRDSARRDGIQVLFFSKEEEYREYRGRFPDVPDTATGFYSLTDDRLIVYNIADASALHAAQTELDQRVSQYRRQATTPEAQASLRQWERANRVSLGERAAAYTTSLLRHEGAHQILYDLGILKPDAPLWLVEGLACYCETDPPGVLDEFGVAELDAARKGGRLDSLTALVNGKDSIGPLAYSESRSLVCYLMRSTNRARFFEYLRHLAESSGGPPASPRETPCDTLCRFLGMTPEDLHRNWLASLPRPSNEAR